MKRKSIPVLIAAAVLCGGIYFGTTSMNKNTGSSINAGAGQTEADTSKSAENKETANAETAAAQNAENADAQNAETANAQSTETANTQNAETDTTAAAETEAAESEASEEAVTAETETESQATESVTEATEVSETEIQATESVAAATEVSETETQATESITAESESETLTLVKASVLQSADNASESETAASETETAVSETETVASETETAVSETETVASETATTASKTDTASSKTETETAESETVALESLAKTDTTESLEAVSEDETEDETEDDETEDEEDLCDDETEDLEDLLYDDETEDLEDLLYDDETEESEDLEDLYYDDETEETESLELIFGYETEYIDAADLIGVDEIESGETVTAAADTSETQNGSTATGETKTTDTDTAAAENSAAAAATSETETEEYVDKNKTLLTRKKLEFDGTTYLYRRGLTNYLIIGTDNSDLTVQSTEGRKNGYICKMADLVMVLVVDETNESYTIVQLDRNTITRIQMLYTNGDILDTADMQLCTAYYYGHDGESACENEMAAVSDLLLNTPIKQYISVGMDSIKDINRIAGGVTVTLDDDFTASDPAMEKGATLTLTDEQADIFVRSRMSMEDDSNVERLRRQRSYLDGLSAKLKANVKADANYIDDAYDQIKDLIVTNAQEKHLAKLAMILTEYQDEGILTLSGETGLGKALGDGIEHEEFYPDQDELRQLVLDLWYEEKE